MGKSSCCDKNGIKKGPWTTEEDEKLMDYIQKHGHGRWRTLPKNAGLKRCGKSCRLRWTNYLRPDIKRGKFSFEEEEIIIQLHSMLGNKWSAMAAQLPGRTDNEIKNYWNTHIKKKLMRMGIDPVTHKPRLDLLQLYSLLNSSLLGMGSISNPGFLSLATSLLSCQGNNSTLDENQFQGLQQNQLQNQITQACTDSRSAQILNEIQLVQNNMEQAPHNSTNFSCQNSLQSSWQAASIGESLDDQAGPHIKSYVRSAHASRLMPYHKPKCDLSRLVSSSPMMSSGEVCQGWSDDKINGQLIMNTSFVSTPSPSTMPLHSSSTIYVNDSIEDERDSYRSDMLMFDIPSSFEVNSLM